MVPVSYELGWLKSVAYVSALSLLARNQRAPWEAKPAPPSPQTPLRESGGGFALHNLCPFL